VKINVILRGFLQDLFQRDVREPVQHISDVIEPAAVRDLAEFNRRHSDILSAGRGDVPLLIQRQVVQRSAVHNRQTYNRLHRAPDSGTPIARVQWPFGATM
jgi:hypothetical protein